MKTPQPSQEPFRIKGEHAIVTKLTRKEANDLMRKNEALKKVFKGKVRHAIIRRERLNGSQRMVYSATHALAHLLYPKNFPLIIASGVEKEHRPHGETTSRVTYSKKVPLTLESQNVIEKYYLYKSTTFHYFTAFENKHYYKVFQQAERIFEESGIHPNSQMMNVGLRRKGNRPRFVFFEVSWINIPKLHKFIRAMPESNSAQKLRKKQAMELFEFIKKRWAREYKIKWKGYRRKTMEIMTH